MDAKETLYELQMERFEVFKTQDPENEHFDGVFEFNGKKLYANKFMICSISSTFNSMLSKRWTKPDEPIIIQEYSYDDFKQLLTFIYSGECSLTADNIFAMVDIAEFYGILLLKKYCEEFLADVKLDAKNVFGYRELVCKYSMTKLKQIFDAFIVKNLGNLFNTEQFSKTVLKDMVESNHEIMEQEDLFEAVFKWAEIQAIEKQKTQQSLNLNEAIKAEITDFLPFFKYEKMNDVFFITFVVNKAFLFSGDELTNLLLARSKVHVKITDGNGITLKGILQCPDIERIAAVIQSQKNINPCIEDSSFTYWETKPITPSAPSYLTKNESIKWYLLLSEAGHLYVVSQKALLEDDYLLAEMFAEDEFKLDDDCKIEVYCFS